jgi:predicted carbohydrate-binding protein with CBM5 and CBM33 domain
MKPLNKEQLELVSEFRDSKLTKREFCKIKCIQQHKLDYLIYKQQKISKSEIDFYKVTKVSNTNDNSSVVINLKDQTITITSEVDDYLLRKVIKAIIL